MDLTLFLAVGFLAELVDGALGMAYGLLSNTVMLALGLPPAVASATVHTAEIVTSAVSGLSHLRFGNVDRFLVRRLLVPGVIGGVLGAYVLVSVPSAYLRPTVALYLVVTGLVIIVRGLRSPHPGARPAGAAGLRRTSFLGGLGLVGGVCDAMGGGGWGQVVTSTLIARGNLPRSAIGSVTFSEFFVALAESVTFFLTIGLQNRRAILGLMVGGAVAAPMAAWTTSRLPHRVLSAAVGALVVLTSARTLLLSLPELVRLM